MSLGRNAYISMPRLFLYFWSLQVQGSCDISRCLKPKAANGWILQPCEIASRRFYCKENGIACKLCRLLKQFESCLMSIVRFPCFRISGNKIVYFFSPFMDSMMQSASASSSEAFSGWRAEARDSLSFNTVISRSSSFMNFSIKSPDLQAQDPFSTIANVLFCKCSAFISMRKLCITG